MIIKLVFVSFCLVKLSSAVGEDRFFEAPFLLAVGERKLDTFEYDVGGHAAPFMTLVDSDDIRDLVVGSINGKFRFFRNLGTNDKPKFAPQSAYLMAGAEGDIPAQVPNFCCVAAGPQFIDLDGDGYLDLTSGSYFPGAIYFFKGLGSGKFAARQMLTELNGLPLFAHPEKNVYEQGHLDSYMSNVAWADWNADGRVDVIVGNLTGEIMVRLNVFSSSSISNTPIKGQPVFRPASWGKGPEVISIGGGHALPERHAAPAVIDWDGDGLWDLLAGSESGAVYFFRNTGVSSRPQFLEREVLIEAGTGTQWVEPGGHPEPGIRSQIHPTDYNNDGKMDLLVGEWSAVYELRAGLTQKERKRAQAIRRELADWDRIVGFNHPHPGYRQGLYSQSTKVEDGKALYSGRVAELERELSGLVRQYEGVPGYEGGREVDASSVRYSGLVRVYLRK